MSVHLADGIGSTCSGTGVDTLVSHAGLVPVALRAQDALWPAADQGIAHKLRQTGALSLVAYCVGAAGDQRTRITYWWGIAGDRRRCMAGCEGVTAQTWSTLARGVMVNHRAQGVESTGSGTGITATLLLAGQVGRAVGVDRTLGAAVGGSAEVGRQATARGSAMVIAAFRELAAR